MRGTQHVDQSTTLYNLGIFPSAYFTAEQRTHFAGTHRATVRHAWSSICRLGGCGTGGPLVLYGLITSPAVAPELRAAGRFGAHQITQAGRMLAVLADLETQVSPCKTPMHSRLRGVRA